MVYNQLKKELEELKQIFAIKYKINYDPSYADVIRILITEYKNSLTAVYPLCQKTLVGVKIKGGSLKVSTLLRKSSSIGVKLDGKTRVSFLLES